MKFAIAAGILAQTLPALSENEAVDRTIKLGQDLASTVARQVKDLRAANRGVQGASFLQGTNDGKAGLLMNQGGLQEDAAKKKKPCNPFSNDPDVGILSCGMGMYCREDESMFLGGKCAPKGPDDTSFLPGKKTHQAASRRLLGLNKIKGMRKPSVVLQNPEQASHNVECDPLASSSIDADVGILRPTPQCEVGQECLPTDASSMGGVCVSKTYSSRMLAENDIGACFSYVPGQCYDPSYPCVAAGYCQFDCAGFENTTGNGVMGTSLSPYCLGLDRFPGCGDRCLTLSAEVTYANFTVLNTYFCKDFTTPYARKRCYDVNHEAGTCTYLIDGEACDSCEIVPDVNYGYSACPILKFDCSNIEGGGAGVNYPIDGIQYDPIIESCYDPGPHPNCTMCPEEGTIFDTNAYYVQVEIPGVPQFYRPLYCGDMYFISYNNPLTEGVPEDYCTAISAVTANYCCIPSNETSGTEDPTSTEEPDGTAPPGAETSAPSSAISMAAGTFVVATSAALAASAIL